MEAFGASDIGRKRQVNEDAFVVVPERGVFIVADGIGGTSGGKAASQVTVEALPGMLHRRTAKLRRRAARSEVQVAVRETLQDLNNAVVAAREQYSDVSEMGTTIVLALQWHDSILLAHLGDSRAYLHRDENLTRLTDDHALAAQLVRWGRLSESQAEDNPGRSQLLRYLGAEEELEPDFRWIQPAPGDRLLLCTDGLTSMLPDRMIEETLGSFTDPVRCCQELISRANEAGGADNITIVVIRFLDSARRVKAAQPGKRIKP